MAQVGKTVTYDSKGKRLGWIVAAQPEMMRPVYVAKHDVSAVCQLAIGKDERPGQRIERCRMMKTARCGFQYGGEG